ncbi:MAG: hypothetical protein ACR2MM_06770 [Flavobacteriaceae bacterium]
MKQFLLTILLVLGFGVYSSHAQVYEAAAGLGLDFGDGETLVGFSGKYFFSEHHAAQGELLFGDVTGVNLLYGYHGGFSGASNLQWFAGGGLGILFGNGDSDVGLRPLVGLDYKLNDVPLGFTFDWRPYISFDQGSEAARFGLGVRYIWE